MDKAYLQITLEDIIEDALKDKKKLAYLKTLAETETEAGVKISFLELKRGYMLQFYPKSVPIKKEKETMWEKIANL